MRAHWVGRVSHFYSGLVLLWWIWLVSCVGDRVVVRGVSTDFEQVVESMQIEHENVEWAGAKNWREFRQQS